MRQLVTDAELTENAAYALHYEVASQLVKLSAESGWVTLTGEVTDAADKAAAERAVGYIRGVRGIRNYITIAPSPKLVETTKFIEAIPAPQDA
jgi:osmotically-inducible protein OsmY